MDVKPFDFEVFKVAESNVIHIAPKLPHGKKDQEFIPFMAGKKKKEEIPSYKPEDLELAEKKGYDKGYKEGLAKIDNDRINADKRITDTIASLAVRIEELSKKYETDLQLIAKDSTRLAYEIARKVAGDALKSNPQENIVSMFSKCLSLISHENAVSIIANPSVAKQLEEKVNIIAKEKNITTKINVAENPSVAETDCIFKWANGGAELNLAEKWKKIAEMINI